jgi:hypothetical protein
MQKIKKLRGSLKNMMDTNDVFKQTVDVYDNSVKEFMVNLTSDLVKALKDYRKHIAQTCECFVDHHGTFDTRINNTFACR